MVIYWEAPLNVWSALVLLLLTLILVVLFRILRALKNFKGYDKNEGEPFKLKFSDIADITGGDKHELH